MRQTNVRGTLSLRGFRKLRTGAIVATGVILLGLGFLAPTVSANEQDGVWVARTVAEVKADIQNIDNLSHYTIKWGDTLSAISGATGLSVDSLVEINRIANRDLIFANSKLYFSEEVFLKDENTEVKRQQVSIDNSGSCQSYEVETKTDTVTGEQTTTVKQTTPVVVETPAVSAAKSETPVTVAPKAETREEVSNAPSLGTTTSADSGESSPATDNAPSNTGTTNQPVASNPSSEVPASSVSSPKVEEQSAPSPKAEEPATPSPKTEELATPSPKAEEPAAPSPKVEEPSAPAPKAEEPVATTPKAEEPSAPAPKAEEPAGTTPRADESVSPAPKAEEPTASAPKVEEPATPAPKAEEPSAPAPKVEEPATPAPKVDEPSAPAPKAEEPVAPTPKAEEPSAPAPKSDEATTPSPKVEEPATPAPKAEEPAAPAPKVEDTVASKEDTSAPNADKLTTNQNGDASNPVDSKDESSTPTPETPTSEPKSEEPTTSTPKNDESGSSVESPSTGNHSEESGTPSETPTGGPTATQPSDTSTELVTPGDTNSTTQPAGETGNSETTAEPSNTPSADATNDSGNSATSTPTPETSTPEPKSEEELKKEEALKSAKKESIDDNIGEVVKIKADAIEKVTDADEKARLKEALKTLQDKAIEEINKAKDDEEVATVTEKYQNEINALDVPGEEVSSPNYGREGLTNNGPGGTTIDNGSTAIGHGASGTSRSAVAAPAQPSSTSEGTSSFRNAPSVQVRARRVARSTSEPDGTVNISYNFAGMPDIHGFLSDPGENNTVTIPAGTNEEQAKELVKEKIWAKIKDLATRGYHVKNDIIFEQDTTVKNYNYVVTFTKEATGTSGFRMAPAVQPRASRNRRSLEQPAPQKVKVNVFYNFDQMKDIAGFLGDINGTSLEIAEGLSNEQVKVAVKNQVEAKKEELSKRGYTFKEDYVYQANGKDYNYVVTFSKSTK